jgi:DNA-binding CsgD family transcriptional regulator/tetratricopeptide (TPR) repeat protein
MDLVAIDHLMLADRGSVPFVGRERELGELVKRLELACAGLGSVVLVGGEPGIGKTRLAQRLAADAEAQGCRVLWGRCWEGDSGAPAFWPWIEALGGYARTRDPRALRTALGPGAADLAQLVPDIRTLLPDLPPPAPVEPEQARFRLFGAVTEFLRRIADANAPGSDDPAANSKPATSIVVVLDDLHCADKASLLLLQYVARTVADTRLLLFGAYRDSELDRTHPLAATLATLRREPACERIGLRGLAEPEVLALIEAQAGAPLDAPGRALAEALHRETEGNPFFVGEMLRHLEESGRLSRQDGRWVVPARGVEEMGIPAGVREVIGHRLSRLSEDTNEVLGVAAVVGRDFDASTIEQAAALDESQLDRALQEAEQAGVIAAVEHGDRYRFAHALLRETLYAEMATRRRRRLHRQIGEAREAQHGARLAQHAAELAYHFVEAGEPTKAILYSRLAAEQAAAATAWEEAARHYERCLVLYEDAAHPDVDDAEILMALGRCYLNVNEGRAAWRTLMRAIERYRERQDHAGVARATLAALRVPAPPERHDALARDALAVLDGREPHLEAQLLLRRTVWTQADGGEASRQRVTELAQQYGLKDVESVLTHTEGNIALQSGQPEEARRIYQRAYAVCAGLGKLGWAARFLSSANAIPLLAGELDDGVVSTRQSLAYAREVHEPIRESGLLISLAGVALARGELEQYEGLLAGAAAVNHANFNIDLLRAARWEVAGDLARALAQLPAPERAGGLPDWLAVVHGGRARTRFHAGDEAGARAELAIWARLWAPFRIADGTPGYLHSITCVDAVLPALGDDELVRAVYAELQGWSWARFGPSNPCGVDQMRGALALRLELIDEAEQHYDTGLAWAERERCPVEAGRCLLGLAGIATLRGQDTQALSLLDRAITHFTEHDAKLYLDQALVRRSAIEPRHPPALERSADPEPESGPSFAPAEPEDTSLSDGLSPRQVEVLRLIAAGKTNQEIAAELVISLHTVTRHVTHIFARTGASNRAEAASYGHRHHLI